MPNTAQKNVFVLASTEHGTMLVNRLDYSPDGRCMGVGEALLERGSFEAAEVDELASLLTIRRQHFGDGVIVIDGGANIGVHTLGWARHMRGWGQVIAFEAQERLFYALAGNITLNNLFNARALNIALAGRCQTLMIPQPDYQTRGCFGGFELRSGTAGPLEDIGQPVDYSSHATVPVQAISIDSLNLPRLDFLKLDVEGMEFEVLAGARETIDRCKPVLFVETVKAPRDLLKSQITAHGYETVQLGLNILCIHHTDSTLRQTQRFRELCIPSAP